MSRQQEQAKISDAEWSIMRVVWTKGMLTSQEAVEILGDELNWKAATIKTLLNRLVKKGILKTTIEGKKYIYSPTVSEEETIRSATETFFSRICSRKIGATLAELIRETELTEEDLALILEVLREKQAVKEIECNCIPGQCSCSEHQ